jgi:hypothetical protein
VESGKNEISARCKSNLEDSGFVLPVLDGSQVDDGTAWETRTLRLNPPSENDDSVLAPKAE